MLFIFLQSFAIGLSIALPIGPMATLCIKTSLDHGWKLGFAVGLGSALAEGSFSFIAGGGLVFISQFLTTHLFAIKLIGSLILVFMGLAEIKTFRENSGKEIKMKTQGFKKTLAFSLALSMTNPMMIILFVGIFATLGDRNLSAAGTAISVLGVFCGALAWTTILSGIVAKIRHKISKKWTARLKLISGVMISAFGFYGILGLF